MTMTLKDSQLKALSLFTAFFLFAGIPQALADQNGKLTEASSSKADIIHSVVESQLKAFRDRDATSAFTHISESMHNSYKDAKQFLNYIRYQYDPLYNHVSYRFLGRIDLGDKLIQKVELTDPEGVPVIVMLRLVKEDQDNWVIDGFMLLESNAQPT